MAKVADAEDTSVQTDDGVVATVTLSGPGAITVTRKKDPGSPEEPSGWRFLFQTLALLQLPTAILGIAIGGLDLASAPWLFSRILGLMLLLLGVVVLVGLVVDILCFFRELTAPRQRLILAGAVAGFVIDIIFLLDMIHYTRGIKVILVGVSALSCALVTWYFFNWPLVKKSVKLVVTAGVVTALASVTPFIYTSIYLPSTANVAIEPSLDSATVSPVGPGLDLVNVRLSVTDQSSVRVVTLTSMVAVYGITYSDQKDDFSGSPSQGLAVKVGLGTSGLVPNLAFNGRHQTLITLQRVEADGSFLNPSVPLTTSVPVLIPAGKYQELDVAFSLWYARADRLTLTHEYFPTHLEDFTDYCPDDIRTAYFIAQTTLGREMRGTETAATDWCASISDPKIGAFIGGAPGHKNPGEVTALEEQSVQLRHTSRYWVVQLPGS